MLEQAVSGFGLMKMLREGSGPRPMRPEEVRCGQFLDHACYYLPKREEELAFLRNAPSYEPEVESHDGPIPSLTELAARLASDGVEIAVARPYPARRGERIHPCRPRRCGRSTATPLRFRNGVSRKLEASTLAEEGAEPGATPILLTEPAASSGFCDGGTLDV